MKTFLAKKGAGIAVGNKRLDIGFSGCQQIIVSFYPFHHGSEYLGTVIRLTVDLFQRYGIGSVTTERFLIDVDPDPCDAAADMYTCQIVFNCLLYTSDAADE